MKNVLQMNRVLVVTVLTIFSMANWSVAETVIAFGDSLTEGCGDPSQYYYQCGWQGRDDTYPLYIERLAAEDNHQLTVKNFGIGGQTTGEGLIRLDSVLNDSCNPEIDYVLLLMGTNDLFHHNDESVVQYNLGLMIDKILARGIIPLIATITPDPDHTWKNIELMNSYIKELAYQKDIAVVDLYSEMASGWYWYTNPQGCYMDNLHPNSLGFQKIASVWYATLAENFKKPVLLWLQLLLK